MSSIPSTESAAGWASTKENPRLPYATGSTGLAITVRGSSRRIMIMRFRPANIRLINRRQNLPRLLLALFSGKGNDNCKNNYTEVAALTGSLHIRASHSSTPLWQYCRLFGNYTAVTPTPWPFSPIPAWEALTRPRARQNIAHSTVPNPTARSAEIPRARIRRPVLPA